MQDSSSDDELFGVGLGDLSVAVDDDSAADVAEPSAADLETFRAVELAGQQSVEVQLPPQDADEAVKGPAGDHEEVLQHRHNEQPADDEVHANRHAVVHQLRRVAVGGGGVPLRIRQLECR